MKTHKLILKKDKDFSLLKGHPWAFAEAFKALPENIKTGDIAEVYSHKDTFIGSGYIDKDSTILVRMIPANKNESFDFKTIGEVSQKIIEIINNRNIKYTINKI